MINIKKNLKKIIIEKYIYVLYVVIELYSYIVI
jgi:hypothetical protein